MKLIIAGSRNINLTVDQVQEAVVERWSTWGVVDGVSEVVCGLARGPDLAGKEWAKSMGIPVKEFPANWEQFGRKAGALRNIEMAEYADELLAYWDGKSRGTQHMIKDMENRKKKVHIVKL